MNEKIGLYSGVFGLIITPLMIIIAFINEPTYKPLLQTISKLGVTNHGQMYFISGMCIGGCALISFYYFSFSELSKRDKQLKIAQMFGIISGIGLIGVGIIQDKHELFYRVFHWLSSVIFFLFSVLFIIYFLNYLKRTDLNQKYSFLYKTGFVPIIVLGLYVLLSLFTHPIMFASVTFKIPVIWQKISVFTLISWYFILFYNQFTKNLVNSLLFSKNLFD